MKLFQRKPNFTKILLAALLCLCLVCFMSDAFGRPLLAIFNFSESVFSSAYKGSSQIKKAFSVPEDTKEDTIKSLITELEIKAAQTDSLRQLLDMKDSYSDYETTGASVIGKEAGGWYDIFIIDKGSEDGIKEGMNVLSSKGLAGIVAETGRHTAKVTSLIDESSNVSCMSLTTRDLFMAEGESSLKNEGKLGLTMAAESSDIQTGDKVVTSYVSSNFLPGLFVGYVSDIYERTPDGALDGEILPVTDFEHLNSVLVIKTLKSELLEELS